MASLSPDILTRLRATLLRCRQFESDRALHALFADDRIAPWAGEVQDAYRAAERVDFVISLLRDRDHAAYGENALVLLLHALRDTVHPHDALHAELAALAKDLTGSPKPVRSDEPTPQLARARKVLHHLEMQAAGFGALHIPAHLQIELEEQREKVAALEAQNRR